MPEIWRFDAIGVPWQIETVDPLDQPARRRVETVIRRFDAEWSRFRVDSVVSRLARDGGRVVAPPDTIAMLDAYATLSAATDGAVSPLVGDALARRGYDSTLSLVDRGAAPAPDWSAELAWDDDELRLRHPATIDVGALGKGRLVDLVLAALDGDAVVDASGDLAVRGAPQRIGLEHPFDPRRAIGVWEVQDAALCASATNRRAWGDGLHHVLDARTGEPVRTIAATWAVASTAMRADGVATALFFDGGERVAHEWGVEWVRMTTDGRVEWSPGSKAELFT
ncbi:FAD:protein FMN transferase [Microbacterium aoyamense]|uniref:FAD:protein FMN transferase n=1 Tax=Microbacterium aoyamense TaxID=344166 RepID=A0ABN2Q057_9MICO|nr:FAD:protein FMN transferase [Microbacterium aoyamense]